MLDHSILKNCRLVTSSGLIKAATLTILERDHVVCSYQHGLFPKPKEAIWIYIQGRPRLNSYRYIERYFSNIEEIK